MIDLWFNFDYQIFKNDENFNTAYLDCFFVWAVIWLWNDFYNVLSHINENAEVKEKMKVCY